MKNSGNEERKEEKERHASWLELFHDLVFVAVVSQLSENLGHNISWTGLLSFVVLFIPVWFAWVGATFFATRFGTDDLAHRVTDFASDDGGSCYGSKCYPWTW